MTREALERAVAVRLGKVHALAYGGTYVANADGLALNPRWIMVAREALAMCERVAIRAVEIENVRMTGLPGPIDLTPALEESHDHPIT